MPQHEWPLQFQRLNQRRDIRDKQWIRDTGGDQPLSASVAARVGHHHVVLRLHPRATRSQVIPPAMMPCSKTSAGLPLPDPPVR